MLAYLLYLLTIDRQRDSYALWKNAKTKSIRMALLHINTTNKQGILVYCILYVLENIANIAVKGSIYSVLLPYST